MIRDNLKFLPAAPWSSELIAGNAGRMDAIVKACEPHFFYVSINGADCKRTWREWIRPLDD